MSEHSRADTPAELSPEAVSLANAAHDLLNQYRDYARTDSEGLYSLELYRLAMPSPGSADAYEVFDLVTDQLDNTEGKNVVKINSIIDYHDGQYEEATYAIEMGIVTASQAEWDHAETADGPVPTTEKVLSAQEVSKLIDRLTESRPTGNIVDAPRLSMLGRITKLLRSH